GSFVPHKTWHDVGALVEDVAGRLRPVTTEHPVRLDVQEDLPPIELDYVEIQQVLSNLVENAAKFSPPGSEIAIRVGRDDGHVRYRAARRADRRAPPCRRRRARHDPHAADESARPQLPGGDRGERGRGEGELRPPRARPDPP